MRSWPISLEPVSTCTCIYFIAKPFSWKANLAVKGICWLFPLVIRCIPVLANWLVAGPGRRPQGVWPSCESPSGSHGCSGSLRSDFSLQCLTRACSLGRSWTWRFGPGWESRVLLGLWKAGLHPCSEREDGRLSGLNFYLGDVCLHRQLPLGMSMFRLFMQKEDWGGQKAKSTNQASTKGKQGYLLDLPGSQKSLVGLGFCFCFYPVHFRTITLKTPKTIGFFSPSCILTVQTPFPKEPGDPAIVTFLPITAGLYQSVLALRWLPLPWPGSPATQLSRSAGGCLRDAPCWADVSS